MQDMVACRQTMITKVVARDAQSLVYMYSIPTYYLLLNLVQENEIALIQHQNSSLQLDHELYKNYKLDPQVVLIVTTIIEVGLQHTCVKVSHLPMGVSYYWTTKGGITDILTHVHIDSMILLSLSTLVWATSWHTQQ